MADKKIKFLTISVTLEKNGQSYFVKATQKLNPEFNIGHYSGYIEDSKGNVVDAFTSTNAPKDPITVEELADHLNRYLK